MARFFGASALVVIASLTASLAGCTPTTVPVAGPTPERSVSPADSESASPAVRPNASFDVGCADLLTLAEVQSRITNPLEIHRDESNVPGAYRTIIDIQEGALSCIWSRGVRFTSLGDDGVELFVKSDSVELYDIRTAGESYAEFVVNGADSARRFCTFGGFGDGGLALGGCSMFALVGTTIIEFTYWDHQPVFSSEQAVADVATGLLQLVVDRIRSANSQEQLWAADPTAQVADSAFCADMGAATVAALGVPSSSGGPIAGPFATGLSGCEHFGASTDFPMIQLWVIQSGAWAIDVDHTESPGYNDPFSRRTTASGATWWLSVTDLSLYGRAAVGGSLVEVTIYPPTGEVSIAQAEAAMVTVMERYAEIPPSS